MVDDSANVRGGQLSRVFYLDRNFLTFGLSIISTPLVALATDKLNTFEPLRSQYFGAKFFKFVWCKLVKAVFINRHLCGHRTSIIRSVSNADA